MSKASGALAGRTPRRKAQAPVKGNKLEKRQGRGTGSSASSVGGRNRGNKSPDSFPNIGSGVQNRSR